MSLYYFAFFAAMGVYFPYLPVWLRARGFDVVTISVFAALSPALGVLSPPLFGLLSDKLGLRGSLLRMASLGAIGSVIALVVVTAPSVSLGFWGLFCCVFAFTFFRTIMHQLCDVVALEHGGDYGRMRMWGSVGFMLVAAVAGRWVPMDPAWVFPAWVLLGLAFVQYATNALPRRAALPFAPVLSEARKVLMQPGCRLFLMSTLLGQAAHAAYDLCITLHLSDLGASGTEIGVAWATATAAEVVLMGVSARLLQRYSAATWLVASLAIGALRWGLLASLTDVYVILLLQPLHAFTFGVRWVGSLALVKQFASTGTLATLQGLFLAASSVGSVFGMLTWGVVYEAGGGSSTFAGAALLGLLAALLTLRLPAVLPRNSS